MEVVSAHVRLRPAGRNFIGLCPFHQEKTPSFNVNRERQIYHCFGCHKGGDVISFLMDFEGASFSEAIRDLAGRAGIDVPSEFWRAPRQDADADARRDRWRRAIDAADAFFRATLRDDPAGAPAREYLVSRGVSADVAERFGLGFAPPAWDRLCAHLSGGRHSLADAETMGLVVARQGGDGWYDRFRGRLVFPVHDMRGAVVAFSGRVLPGLESEGTRDGVEAAKYINSPETPLYRKGRSFLGLVQARQAIRRSASVVLVEGNFDLVAVHALGRENVLAPLGTALTPEQAAILRRMGVESVTLLLDPDDAGRAAARRAFPVLASVGLGVRWAAPPEGRDPGDLLPGGERAVLDAVLDGAPSFLDRAVREAAAASGDSPDARAAAARDLAQLVATIRDVAERDLRIGQIAAALGLNRHVVGRLVERPDGRPGDPRAPVDGAGGAHPPPDAAKVPDAEDALLAAILARPALAGKAAAEGLDRAVTYEPLARVLRHLEARAAEGDGQAALATDELVAASGDLSAQAWVRGVLIRASAMDPADAADRFEEAARRVRAAAAERTAAPIGGRIRAAQAEGDDHRAVQLLQEKRNLRRKALAGTFAHNRSGARR